NAAAQCLEVSTTNRDCPSRRRFSITVGGLAVTRHVAQTGVLHDRSAQGATSENSSPMWASVAAPTGRLVVAMRDRRRHFRLPFAILAQAKILAAACRAYWPLHLLLAGIVRRNPARLDNLLEVLSRWLMAVTATHGD